MLRPREWGEDFVVKSISLSCEDWFYEKDLWFEKVFRMVSEALLKF